MNAFLEEAEKEGYAVLPVFANGFIDESAGMPSLSEVLETYFMKDGQPVIDALVSTMKFSMLGAGKTSLPVLKKLGVPILSAYTLLTSESDWRKNPEGMNAVETSIAVALPELDGAIAGLPIAGRKKDVDGSVSYVPIPERVTQMVKKAGKWASLHQMKNENKKIAIIFHNYPAKNSNIGSASGLDTMESTIRLMKEMKKAGYQMDFIPETSDDFIRLMTSHATNDISMMTEEQAESCQKLSCREYLDFFRRLGKEAKASMEDTWGEAPGDVMISEKAIFSSRVRWMDIFSLRYSHRVSMGWILRRRIMTRRSRRRISISLFTTGCVTCGKRMLSFIWGRMEILSGFRGKVSDLMKKAIRTLRSGTSRISIHTI